ncbi:uncharacterized protein K441DRAFT_540469, partial [Cenococcum geophilum 1.58]|uniref:uncharacterized protein n=1 Tax=Cenococcum geophilum 1.58 TaxID=794803 RepID=UPI00358E6CF7
QIKWEFNGLERATVITIFFNPNTISPISLLKLSEYIKDRKLVVYCPKGYFR